MNDNLLHEVVVKTGELQQHITNLAEAQSSQRKETTEANKTLLECVESIKNEMGNLTTAYKQQSEKLAWLETQLTQRAIPAN